MKSAILFIPSSKRQILPPTSLPARSAKQILPKRFIQQMRLKFPTASPFQILIIMNRLMFPPEAFITSPIFDGGKRIGVLIFQLSVKK